MDLNRSADFVYMLLREVATFEPSGSSRHYVIEDSSGAPIYSAPLRRSAIAGYNRTAVIALPIVEVVN